MLNFCVIGYLKSSYFRVICNLAFNLSTFYFYHLIYIQQIIVCTTVKFLLYNTGQVLHAIPNFTALLQYYEPNSQHCLVPRT